MLSDKKNVLQVVALLKAYDIDQIVLSPGSRNSPFIQTFTQCPFFNCHLIVDERNAAFYALGIIQRLRKPVVICCTSGTAVLNYAPAVAEAYYQGLPLIVISADRALEWIGQMDGQTLPQYNCFNGIVKKSVQLPEIHTSSDEWFCNRLVNEALIDATRDFPQPVHINVPISEPLFNYNVEELPEVRKVTYQPSKKISDVKSLLGDLSRFSKRMIVVGQLPKDGELTKLLEKLAVKHNFVVLTEHLSNQFSDNFIGNFDAVLYALSENNLEKYVPDLLITFGGHIVSKRLKHFLRKYPVAKHIHFSENGEVIDLFQSLIDISDGNVKSFFEQLVTENSINRSAKEYADLWNDISNKLPEPDKETEFSDVYITGRFLRYLPSNSYLHLANSSPVRNSQLYSIKQTVEVFCNRGTNGIEGSLPTAVGFASVTSSPVFLLTGDLTFFYGLNALWNISHIKNLRILLFNNGGGNIFHLLPGLNKAESLKEYVAAGHTTSAKEWVNAAGFTYLQASNKGELEEGLEEFVKKEMDKSIVLEVFTDTDINTSTFKKYYHQLKDISI